MTSLITIREACRRDLPSLRNLLYEWEGWRGQPTSFERAIRRREIVVAEAHGRLLGFLHYGMHEDVVDGGPNGFITALYVSPPYRSKGIGSKLLQQAVEEAVTRGAVGIGVSTASRRAKKFYERHGFKPYWIDRQGRKRFEVYLERHGQQHEAEACGDPKRS